MALMGILLQASAPIGGNYSGLVMIVLIFIIMYFFMIRPQQKQRKKIELQRAALKVGDKVMILGGIYGKLKRIKDTSYIVEIAEEVEIEVDKLSVFANISNIIPDKMKNKKKIGEKEIIDDRYKIEKPSTQ